MWQQQLQSKQEKNRQEKQAQQPPLKYCTRRKFEPNRMRTFHLSFCCCVGLCVFVCFAAIIVYNVHYFHNLVCNHSSAIRPVEEVKHNSDLGETFS
jgi:hypothetical protein